MLTAKSQRGPGIQATGREAPGAVGVNVCRSGWPRARAQHPRGSQGSCASGYAEGWLRLLGNALMMMAMRLGGDRGASHSTSQSRSGLVTTTLPFLDRLSPEHTIQSSRSYLLPCTSFKTSFPHQRDSSLFAAYASSQASKNLFQPAKCTTTSIPN